MKVKIPKSVADEIEDARKIGADVWDIVYTFAGDSMNHRLYPELITFAKCRTETFLKALVNGYEVEETPEDKVRYYYMKQSRIGDLIDSTDYAIRHVLDLLGIKIEGINK